jgi:hypothetical protein
MSVSTPELAYGPPDPGFDEYRTFLGEVIHKMVDMSRTSGAPGAHDHLPQAYRPTIEYLGRLADGYFIGGGSTASRYFYESFEEEGYAQANTENFRRPLAPFKGINRGVEEITVIEKATEKRKAAERRFLCMALDPLATKYDQGFDAYVVSHYGNNFLRNPMGSFRHVGRRIWLPLFDISSATIKPLYIQGNDRLAE